jgi:chorismate mutase/prephenate dehydratase
MIVNKYPIYTLGPAGTNGHRVALEVQQSFGSSEIVFLDSHNEIFSRVSEGELCCGVVPIENSSEGLISEVIDYWRTNKNSDLQVIREYILPIRHHILVREHTDIENVGFLYSRSEVFMQCKRTLAKHNFKLLSASSTANAAEIVLNSEENIGLIGSDFLASFYGLKVAIPSVNDFESNNTKFHVISRTERPHNGDGRTAIMFRVGNCVGSLVNFLNLFVEKRINIASLHSLPIWNDKEVAFYCELDCYIEEFPALSSIQKITKRFKMLGSYDRHILV